MRVHFMGIGGSGMSAAALLAHKNGYEVDGCDMAESTPYIEKLKNKIDIKVGHSEDHLKDVDILLVTPAVYFNSTQPEEVKKAKQVMTWQEFLGKHLMSGKEVIAVAGTHGKSTTAAMLASVFDDASALIGAKVKQWDKNYRFSFGSKFVVEADEFYNSFLHYKPNAIILNNIEFDHPDFFESEDAVHDSFKKFILSLKNDKVLVYNKDSKEAASLVGKVNTSKIKLISYSILDHTADFHANIVQKTPQHIKFEVYSKKYKFSQDFTLHLVGNFNVSNALGVIALSVYYDIDKLWLKRALDNFYGIGRRMELVGEKRGVKIYDDYAHHPTAIRVTLDALKQKHSNENITAIIEPHSYSRTKALLLEYKDAFAAADEVIIAPIFKARDTDTFGVGEEDIVEISGNKNVKFIDSFDKIASHIKKSTKPKSVVIVMGAGKSHELSRLIYESLT